MFFFYLRILGYDHANPENWNFAYLFFFWGGGGVGGGGSGVFFISAS